VFCILASTTTVLHAEETSTKVTQAASQVELNSAPDKDAGWRSLFNGTNLDGWVLCGEGKHTWKVKDGVIIGVTAIAKYGEFLCLDREYADFEMTYEVLVGLKANSGVVIRSITPEETPHKLVGTQIEVSGRSSGLPFGLGDGRKWLIPDDVRKAKGAKSPFNSNEWNAMRIRVVGKRIQTWINGVEVLDLTDKDMPDKGRIGLQVHGSKEAGRTVSYRNLRIRDLSSDTDSNDAKCLKACQKQAKYPDYVKPQSSPLAVIDEHLDALNKGDPGRLMAQYVEETQIHLPNGVVIEGREALNNLFSGFVKPLEEEGLKGMQFTALKTMVVGNTLVVLWKAEADFLEEPYYGSDAYVTKDGLMYAQVSTFDGTALKIEK